MRRSWVVGCVLAGVLAAAATAAAHTSSPSAPGKALAPRAASTCTSATIGIMAPLTGPGIQTFLGTDQLHWVQLYVDQWNKHHHPKIQLEWGNTATGARAVARRFARNGALLATVGPATAGDVRAAGPVLKSAGIPMVSASALANSLVSGAYKGFFFRVVPNASTEGPTVVAYMQKKLGVGKGDTVLVVSDGTGYATAIDKVVAKRLQAAGVSVDEVGVNKSQTNFTGAIGKIGSKTKVVFLPLSPDTAQAFGKQMKAAGKSATLFGSQATVQPGTFSIEGSYLSFFAPFAAAMHANAAIVNTFVRAYGPPGPFGTPAYAATQVIVNAIAAACSHGKKVTRALVRQNIPKTNIKKSVLGRSISFEPNGDLTNGSFWIYKIVKGIYTLQRS